MWLELQTGIGVPLSRQVYEQIKALILRGDLKAEEKLPSSRTLGKDLGIARHTVLDAYEQLLAEGYLEARHGSGTRVAHGIAAVMLKPGTAVPLPVQRRPQAHVIETGCINFRSGIPALENFPQKEWGRLYRGICESLPLSLIHIFTQRIRRGLRLILQAAQAFKNFLPAECPAELFFRQIGQDTPGNRAEVEVVFVPAQNNQGVERQICA